MSDDLASLIGLAHERTKHLDDQRTPATHIYETAKSAAQTLPEPLGSALAGVFAMAEYERRLTGLGGVAGDSVTMLSLALAVIECAAATQSS